MTKESIKITMLGDQGTGKTTYMLAMYAAMSLGVRSFTFTARNHNDDVVLGNVWDQFERTGAFPSATTQSRSWPFDCSYSFKKLVGFEWFDYRGNALLDQKDGEQADVAELHKQVADSDCLIACLAGDRLSAYCDGSDQQLVGAMNRFGRRLNKFLQEHRSQHPEPVPVVIAMTKADLFPQGCAAQKEDQVRAYRDHAIERIKKDLLSALFGPGGNFLVMFCPVSVGDIGNLKDNEAASPAAIHPKGVHLPVTFAVYTELSRRLEEGQLKKKETSTRLTDASSHATRMSNSGFRRFFTPGKVARSLNEAERVRHELGVQEQECANILNSMEMLKNELMAANQPGVQIYFNGSRIPSL